MSEGDPTKFHLDKSISVGHLVTTVTLVVALIGGLVTTDRRIENNADEIDKNTLRIEAAEARATRESERQAEDRQQVRAQLQRIENKLDRYIEGDR